MLGGNVLDEFVKCYDFAMKGLIDGIGKVWFMENGMKWGR